MVRFCQGIGVKNLFSPPIGVLGDGLKKTIIREIRIEDLLGREEIKVNVGISRYNEMVLRRGKLLQRASESNPIESG